MFATKNERDIAMIEAIGDNQALESLMHRGINFGDAEGMGVALFCALSLPDVNEVLLARIISEAVNDSLGHQLLLSLVNDITIEDIHSIFLETEGEVRERLAQARA